MLGLPFCFMEWQMPDAYPYTLSNNKIGPILNQIRTAAKPERFTRTTLQTWGFTASNDRAMLGILKDLGFLNEGGVPTLLYDRLRDPNDWKSVLGEQVRSLYADLFAINGRINAAPEGEIKGAISRVTGKDEGAVKRYFGTFKTLTSLASFEPKVPPTNLKTPLEGEVPAKRESSQQEKTSPPHGLEYHYNLQIHLPATTDISVFNAIFKSLREHLGP